MLPRVKIEYANGALGQVAPSRDGVVGLCAIGAKAVSTSFVLNTPYLITKFEDIEKLGITASNNELLFRQLKEFYAEAQVANLWLMGFATSKKVSDVLDSTVADGAKALIQAAKGDIKVLTVIKAITGTPTIAEGLDSDIKKAIGKAQEIAEWATTTLFAPLFVLLEGSAFNGNVTELTDLHTMYNNRVAVVIGDTIANSKNAAVGLVAGRIASSSVEKKISRVRTGALRTDTLFIANTAVENAGVETINDRGYITFRNFVGKAGYFIADDNLATRIADDYSSITNRRVIDKAYRIAYSTLIEHINDNIAISGDGKLSPVWTASLSSEVERNIVNTMGREGNLGNSVDDTQDTGVTCFINREQDILATSTLQVALSVKPKGYAKYIEVQLGFKTK